VDHGRTFLSDAFDFDSNCSSFQIDQETQRLLELARRFDLRFIVIEDQYNSNLEGPVKSEPPSDLTAEVAQLQTMQSNKLHLAQQLQQLQLVMQQQQQAGQTINPQLVTAFAGLSAQFQQVNNQSILLQQSLQQKAGQLQAQRPRTCEQLQERFYAVQKQLLCVRVLSELKLPAPNQQQPQQSYTFPSAHLASGVDLSKHPLFARSFDAAHERNRRAALAKLLERTPGAYLCLNSDRLASSVVFDNCNFLFWQMRRSAWCRWCWAIVLSIAAFSRNIVF
jgi:hypothetical protein